MKPRIYKVTWFWTLEFTAPRMNRVFVSCLTFDGARRALFSDYTQVFGMTSKERP